MLPLTSDDGRLKRASELIRAGRSAEAIPLLDAVLQAEGLVLWALEERGRARQFTGDLDGAESDFSSIVEHWPSQPRGFMARANARRDANDLHGAFDDLSAALTLDPHHPGAFLSRGQVRVALGDLDGALEDFSRDIAISAEGPLSGLLNRGLLKQTMGDLPGALADFDEALYAEGPEPVYAPLYRARVKTELVDLEGAIEDYTRALAAFPGLSNAYRERAQALQRHGDNAAARCDLEEYRRLGGKDLPAYTRKPKRGLIT